MVSLVSGVNFGDRLFNVIVICLTQWHNNLGCDGAVCY